MTTDVIRDPINNPRQCKRCEKTASDLILWDGLCAQCADELSPSSEDGIGWPDIEED